MASVFALFDVLLLDIEGTVCPISFVKDVLVCAKAVSYSYSYSYSSPFPQAPAPSRPLPSRSTGSGPHAAAPESRTQRIRARLGQFPYALDALPGLLDNQWDAPDFASYRNAFPQQYRDQRPLFEAHVRDLVSRDVKAPYLKALQGYLWQQGYASGELKAPLFDDVAPFIAATHAAGSNIMIYSSGSVPAQKLLFSHTTAEPSDLTPIISDWFDTVNAGPKTDAESYSTIISKHPHIHPHRWLFLSDNAAEVNAAARAGMRSLPVVRPGNAPLSPQDAISSTAITSFDPEAAAEKLGPPLAE